MHLAAGKVPQEPRVHCAEREIAGPGPGVRALHIPQDPLQLCCRKVGVRQETGLAAYDPVEVAGLEPVALGRRAAVLPDDGVADRLPRGPVPHEGCLTLVRDADGGDVIRLERRLTHDLFRHPGLGGPDGLRVVLDPAGPRKDLRKLLLRNGDDAACTIEEHGARTARALIECENVGHRGGLRGRGADRFGVAVAAPSGGVINPGLRCGGKPFPAARPAGARSLTAAAVASAFALAVPYPLPAAVPPPRPRSPPAPSPPATPDAPSRRHRRPRAPARAPHPL